VYRNDRNYDVTGTERGGGVLIAIHRSLDSEILKLKSDDTDTNDTDDIEDAEQIWAKVKIHKKSIILGACYLPPSSNINKFENISNSIKLAHHQISEHDEVIVFGDFNRPKLEFLPDEDNPNIFFPCNLNDKIDEELIDSFYSNDMYQISHIKNSKKVQLDLVFSSITDNFFISEASADEQILNNSTYHSAIVLTYNFDLPHKKVSDSKMYYFDFRNADYEKINNQLLITDWGFMKSENDLDIVAENLDSILFKILENHVPKKLKKEQTNEPWLSKELRNLRNKRNKIHKKLKNSHSSKISDLDRENHMKLYKEFETKSNLAYDLYVKQLGNEIINNPRKFHKFIASKRKGNGFPTTMHLDQIKASDPQQISYLFASHFKKTYRAIDDSPLPNYDYIVQKFNISEMEISLEHVYKKLLNLDCNKGAGPDQIPPEFLKNCADTLAYPLHNIFNRSLSLGKFPDSWKKSYLIPIYKSGGRTNTENYRGIAILSTLPKLFEKLVCDKLHETLTLNFHNEQHGFMKNRSINSNLMIYSKFIFDIFEKNSQVDAIYTDFSKAFDSVDHKILIKKLSILGFSGNFLNWIASYLSRRIQMVRFMGSVSNSITVTSGVPQGSHLGPLLFNLFISDLSFIIKDVKHLFYADDLKIFHEIKTVDDAKFLQTKLNDLAKWCIDNKLNLNVNKCHSISFTRRRNKINFVYNLENKNLDAVSKIRDLGILFDDKLTFKPHCDIVINRAKGLLGFIKRRAKEFVNVWVTKQLYLTYVRSVLEFGSVIWLPHTADYISKIESVQKQFLLFALRHRYNPYDYASLPSYEHRLNIIELESLESRRENLSAVFIFNILQDQINSTELKNEVKINNNRTTRISKYLLESNHSTNYGYNNPLNRGIRIFNSRIHCYDKTNAISVDKYKNNLKKCIN
jgi:Reverse transcriptase (RNA-dependent DNA polymerase)